MKSAKVYRLMALLYMWLQMLAALAYSVLQSPVIKPFLSR